MIANHPSPIARDPTAQTETHHVDDRFVPIRVSHLAEELIEMARTAGVPVETSRSLLAAMQAVIDQEANAFEGELMDLYSPYSPDRETIPGPNDFAARTPAGYALLHAKLAYLMDKANFTRLDDVQIDRALDVAASHGLRVRLDPERIESLSLWVRGAGEIERVRRTWRHPIRGVRERLPVFHRLAVVGRLKDDPHVLLKFFKDIPEEDVEALLPHAEISMTWTDRCLMVSGGMGALGPTFLKIISVGLAAVGTFFWTLTIGLGLFMWRTFHGYRRTRFRRDSQRTRHLYYQNLSNNAGTIYTLISLIAQEEWKEAAIGYFVCATAKTPLRTAEEFKMQAAEFLREKFGVRVDFDSPDAMASLERFGLWADRNAFAVLPADQAVSRLHEHWVERRSALHHLRTSESCGNGLLDSVPKALVLHLSSE